MDTNNQIFADLKLMVFHFLIFKVFFIKFIGVTMVSKIT